MIKIGEYICGLLLALLMLPVLLLGSVLALFDIGHYIRIRNM
jgi:hypothetical protein